MTAAQVDFDKLQALVMQEPLAAAGKHFGDAGSERLKQILRFLKQCGRYATVHDKSDVTIFALMQDDTLVAQHRLAQATLFQPGVTILGSIQRLVVEIRDNGSPFVWQAIPADISAVTQTGIVYRLEQGVEKFFINGVAMAVPQVVQGAVSQFILNNFTSLKDALIAYRDLMARSSKCHVLRTAWAEENRLWFTPKPEFKLRQALANYLYACLRHDEIDLREEQNVDDSHPVDLKVVWRMENRSALIEVKWIGKSISLPSRKITQSFTDSRAREGAKQLAEYLEWHRQHAAKEDTRGYLVVFDCRRKKLKETATSLTKADGLHYESCEISFNPEYHKERADFEEPIRMFLEPICL